MKNISICLVFLCLPCLLLSQTTTCDYALLLRQGKAFAKNRQYKKALYKFNSARRCNPAQGDEVDAAIEALLNQVEGEKSTADQERERALVEEKRANEKTVIAQKALTSADSALSELKKQQEKNRRIISLFYFYDDKIALATKNEKFGYIDKEGRILIDFKYNQATTFGASGFAKVTKDSQSVLIDTLGREYFLAENTHDLNGQITALDLSNQGLKYFPLEIIDNPQLEVLLLNGNKLAYIPKEIKALTQLKHLNIAKNDLKELPDEIGMLSNLETLDISDTKPRWGLEDSSNSTDELPNVVLDLFHSLPAVLINLDHLKYLNLKRSVDRSIYLEIKAHHSNCRIDWAKKIFRD